MKKIYLLAATIFLAVTSFSQYDIEVKLNAPVSASTMAPVASQTIDFEITNLGPDAIPTGSIVWFTYIVYDPITPANSQNYSLDDGTLNGLNGVTLPFEVPAGTTVTATQIQPAFGGPITINTSAVAQGNSIIISCLGVGANTQAAIDDLVANGDANDADMANNQDFFIIGATSSLQVNTKDINVYPNPATNFVNFEIDGLENGTVTINSITGQEVVNASFANGTKQIDVNHLNNGVYIYAVRNANGEIVKTNKLVIRK